MNIFNFLIIASLFVSSIVHAADLGQKIDPLKKPEQVLQNELKRTIKKLKTISRRLETDKKLLELDKIGFSEISSHLSNIERREKLTVYLENCIEKLKKTIADC